MDDERTDEQQQQVSRSPRYHHRARAALTRLGLAAMTAVVCTLLVFCIGWGVAELW